MLLQGSRIGRLENIATIPRNTLTQSESRALGIASRIEPKEASPALGEQSDAGALAWRGKWLHIANPQKLSELTSRLYNSHGARLWAGFGQFVSVFVSRGSVVDRVPSSEGPSFQTNSLLSRPCLQVRREVSVKISVA